MGIDFAYSYSEIRSDEKATKAFFEAYEQAFGHKPEGCLGCGGNLKIKYNELMRRLNKVEKTASNGELTVKRRYWETIFSYKEGRRMRRSYGRNMTTAFIDGFKKNSDERQWKAFIKIFENYVEDADVTEDEATEDETIKSIDVDVDVGTTEDEANNNIKVVEDEATEDETIKEILGMGVIEAVNHIKDSDFDREFLLELQEKDARKGVKIAIDNILSK